MHDEGRRIREHDRGVSNLDSLGDRRDIWATSSRLVGLYRRSHHAQSSTSSRRLAGIKRIFGVRGLVKTIVNLLKLVVMILVSWLFIRSHLDEIAVFPKLMAMQALNAIVVLVFKLAMILAILAVVYRRDRLPLPTLPAHQRPAHEQARGQGRAEINGRRSDAQRASFADGPRDRHAAARGQCPRCRCDRDEPDSFFSRDQV